MKKNYKLYADVLHRFDDDAVRQVVFDCSQAMELIASLEHQIENLQVEKKILEAENKLLKKHPTDCGDPECSPYGCICYTR